MKKKLTRFSSWMVLSTILMVNACKKQDMQSPANNNTKQETVIDLNAEHGKGVIPATAEQIAAMKKSAYSSMTQRAPLPASARLVSPPVSSQGSQGSCVGWATATARGISYYYANANNSWSYSRNIMSAAFIYNQIKDQDEDCSVGTYVSDALNLLRNSGVCVYNNMPYDKYDCTTWPGRTATDDAATKRINEWFYISPDNVNTIKDRLSRRMPVIIVIHTDENFDNGGYRAQDNNGTVYHVWDTNNTAHTGSHCICVIGYDDSRHAFLIQNSWGTGWGDSGKLWIDYDMFNGNDVSEAYEFD